MTDIRVEAVAQLVAQGCAIFAPDEATKRQPPVTRVQVLDWLFEACADAGLRLTRQERSAVVDEIQASANGVRRDGGRGVTVGQLRTLLNTLPENLLVFYERLGDSLFNEKGWTTVPFVTERWPAASADRKAAALDYPNYRVVDVAGKAEAQVLSQGVVAMGASVVSDELGRKVLLLTAHY